MPFFCRSNDMHYFFNTLIKKGFFPEILEDPEISMEVKNFIHRIVPKKYQYGDSVLDVKQCLKSIRMPLL